MTLKLLLKKSFFNKKNEKELMQFRNNKDLAKVTIDNKHDKEFRYSGHITQQLKMTSWSEMKSNQTEGLLSSLQISLLKAGGYLQKESVEKNFALSKKRGQGTKAEQMAIWEIYCQLLAKQWFSHHRRKIAYLRKKWFQEKRIARHYQDKKNPIQNYLFYRIIQKMSSI